MIALALLIISAGCALLYVAAHHLQETLDAIDAAPPPAVARLLEAGRRSYERAPAWNGRLLTDAPDWDWPPPHPSITNRKVHDGTKNRPT